MGHTALGDRTEDNNANLNCRPQAPRSKALILEDSSGPHSAVIFNWCFPQSSRARKH